MENIPNKFDRIWRTNYNQVSRYIYRRINRKEDIEDIMQETAIRLYRALARDVFILNETSYMRRIAINVANDFHRMHINEQKAIEYQKYNRQDAYSLPEESEPFDDGRVWQRALYLNVVDGYPTWMVAEIIGKSHEATRKGIQRLKKELKEAGKDAGNIEELFAEK